MALRIIGGAARGRRIPSPRGCGVRPTGARVREALFSIWGRALEGACVLDACAGSGAISLEALSRGAARVIAVEKNPRLCAGLRENARALGLAAGLEVRCADAVAEVERVRADAGCAAHLAFADPPWGDEALRLALLRAFFVPAPICPAVVVEAPAGVAARPEAEGGRLVRERRYGDTALLFYEPARGAPGGGGVRDDGSARRAGGGVRRFPSQKLWKNNAPDEETMPDGAKI